MFKTVYITLGLLSLQGITACSQNKMAGNPDIQEDLVSKLHEYQVPHEYGGWYCPDNLGGFPPIDFAAWASVPVIRGKLPTEKEVKTEAALIYVDKTKYPNAKPIDIQLPTLATYYTHSTKKEEYVIIIQSFTTGRDSIAGFRYLNGGNGSARLGELKILSGKELETLPAGKFISETIKIKATQDEIWEVLSKSENALPPMLDGDFKGYQDIKKINFSFYKDTYLKYGKPTSLFANKLFGNCYIQNDYALYSEKLLLLQSEDKQSTEMKVVAGPFTSDYETRKQELLDLLNEIKKHSEC